MSCCLKAVASADAAAGVEQVRLSCGGHGYMDASNLPATYGLVTAICTYEGENTVLLLQTARYLVKVWKQAVNGQKLPVTVQYLSNATKNIQRPWSNNLDYIAEAYHTVAAGYNFFKYIKYLVNKYKYSSIFFIRFLFFYRIIRIATENMDRRIRNGISAEDAWNQTSIELAYCAEAHCRAFIVKTFVENIKEIRSISDQLKQVLFQLCELYAIYWVLQKRGDFFQVS